MCKKIKLKQKNARYGRSVKSDKIVYIIHGLHCSCLVLWLFISLFAMNAVSLSYLS